MHDGNFAESDTRKCPSNRSSDGGSLYEEEREIKNESYSYHVQLWNISAEKHLRL